MDHESNRPRFVKPRYLNDSYSSLASFSLIATKTGAAQNNAADLTDVALASVERIADGWTANVAFDTFTCGKAGKYRLSGYVNVNPDGVTVAWGNIVGLQIEVNGASVVRDWHTALSTANFSNASLIVTLQAGDLVQLVCKNSSAVNSTIVGGQLTAELLE